MFKFLKLRNSVFGDARRHVPFASIIHKQLFLIFAFLFSFVCIVPVKVSAAAPQIRPQFKPILDTDIVNFQDSYLNLDPAAQAAASLLFGAYVTEYAGLADYGYVFDEVPTNATLKERLIFIGDQVVDTIFLPYNMADQLVLTPLINLGQGIINKVKDVTNVDNFYNSILSSENYGLPYSPDLGLSLNQLFAKEGNLYNWQFSDSVFTSNFDEANYKYDLSGNQWNTYFAYADQLSIPRVRFCAIYTDRVSRFYNVLFGFPEGNYSAFFNTTNNIITIYKDDAPMTGFSGTCVKSYYDTEIGLYNGYISVSNFNASSYNTVQEAFQAFFDSKYILNTSFSLFNNSYYGCVSDLVDKVYMGSSWSNKTEVKKTTDLGFVNTDSLQYLNVINDAIFDLKQLINSIVQAQPDPNYELPLQPIVYNVTQVNGSPLTAEDLEGISFNVTPPDSGIDVPLDVFLPFFDDGKGFISYMWYMTKPLVSYTRSFLETITFDPVDGFNASGPGYFILGVAALGLIGGVIVKFLL